MSHEIRRIRPDEGPRLRALRLGALVDAPLAFSSTVAREAAFTDDVWHSRAMKGAAGEDQVTHVAEREGRWIGIATGLADWPGRSGPVLVGMFVEPAERGRGVAVRLVESIVSWARDRGAARLYLWVTATNDPALRLYGKCGFRPTGKTRPLEHAPSVDELEMVRDL
jgi:GNAT superfamily N-acetyltransferase